MFYATFLIVLYFNLQINTRHGKLVNGCISERLTVKSVQQTFSCFYILPEGTGKYKLESKEGSRRSSEYITSDPDALPVWEDQSLEYRPVFKRMTYIAKGCYGRLLQ